MKTTTYATTVTIIAIASMAGNGYFLNNAHNAANALTECARSNNVFECRFAPTPKQAPTVQYVKEALLPPPVYAAQ